ncbi:MAG: hypothetical protein LC781_05155 [Actinobacteria bacterium]|nr:hypothetical protein [Actinomycetota bacterium]
MLEDLTGRGVKLWREGDELRGRGPKKTLTPEVLAQLKEHKQEILRTLSGDVTPHPPATPSGGGLGAKLRRISEERKLAREVLGPVEDPVTPPAPPGHDPMVKRHTDKARFFHGAWREAWPRDFKVYEGAGRKTSDSSISEVTTTDKRGAR